MIIKFGNYIKEEIDWWENGELIEGPNDEYDDPVDLDYFKQFKYGMSVICIKNCKRTSNYVYCPINIGDVKVIKGVSSEYIWFRDTKPGAGGYLKEYFRVYENN